MPRQVTEPKNGPRRIFIDATYTLGSGKSSGIERVVRNVLRESQQLSEESRLPPCKLVISHGGKFFEVGEEQIERYRRTSAMHRNALDTAPPGYVWMARAACTLVPLRRMKKWFLPQPGHLGVFKLFHCGREALLRRRVARECQTVKPEKGDLFLLPDAYWVNRLRNTVWPAAEEVRASGGKVVTLLYDLIPLTHPEFVGSERSNAFFDYVIRAAENSDMLVAISKTVCNQVRDFLRSVETSDAGYCNRIRSFELGCELKSADGHVRPSVKSVFDSGTAPYLMVATFDPRKNHKLLLDAFDDLWEQGKNCKLCLVGRFGSQCEDTIERIQQHPELGEKLFLFNDLSDAELQYCYRASRGVVFPSIVEGFGLPIVEALWFGKKTFVSDTEIHREVGHDDCEYFSLRSPDELIHAIDAWESKIRDGQSALHIEREPTKWRESATQLLNHCFSLFGGNLVIESPTDSAIEAKRSEAA